MDRTNGTATTTTGLVFGAWTVGFGIALGQIAWEANWKRVRPATLGVGALGILQLIAVLRYPDSLDRTAIQTWEYVAVNTSFVVLGIWGWAGCENNRTQHRFRVIAPTHQ